MEKPYEIGLSQDKTYIYANKFRQPYTLELALKLARDLTRFGEGLEISGCLVDRRGTKNASSATDKYMFAHQKSKTIGIPRHWRYAFLVDQDDDSLGFVETVMKNAGYMFEVFIDEQEAINWLKSSKLA